MKVNYRDLGARIKKKREELNMSQAELASLVNLSTQHVSNVENARSKIGLEKLIAIANVLNCSADELLCGSLRAGGRAIYSDEISAIIEDFSNAEIRALPEFLRNYNYIYRLLKQNMEEGIEE